MKMKLLFYVSFTIVGLYDCQNKMTLSYVLEIRQRIIVFKKPGRLFKTFAGKNFRWLKLLSPSQKFVTIRNVLRIIFFFFYCFPFSLFLFLMKI